MKNPINDTAKMFWIPAAPPHTFLCADAAVLYDRLPTAHSTRVRTAVLDVMPRVQAHYREGHDIVSAIKKGISEIKIHKGYERLAVECLYDVVMICVLSGDGVNNRLDNLMQLATVLGETPRALRALARQYELEQVEYICVEIGALLRPVLEDEPAPSEVQQTQPTRAAEVQQPLSSWSDLRDQMAPGTVLQRVTPDGAVSWCLVVHIATDQDAVDLLVVQDDFRWSLDAGLTAASVPIQHVCVTSGYGARGDSNEFRRPTLVPEHVTGIISAMREVAPKRIAVTKSLERSALLNKQLSEARRMAELVQRQLEEEEERRRQLEVE